MELLLAPMATLTHRALRTLIARFGGCDTYYTEMINAASLINGGPYEKYYIDNDPDPANTIYQIVGNDADKLSRAAAILLKNRCKGIDINMGCSAPDIVKTGAGVAWMGRLSELPALLKAVKSAIDYSEEVSGIHKRFCIKCRLGNCDTFNHFNEEDFYRFIDIVASAGVEQLTIHARCARERYKDHPHYKFIENVARRYKGAFNVVANGDIFDADSLKVVKDLCPSVNSFMVARAAIQKPWVFSTLKNDIDQKCDGNLFQESDIATQIKTKDTLKSCDILGDNNSIRDTFFTDTSIDSVPDLIGRADIPNDRAALYNCANMFIDLVALYLPCDFYKTRLQRFFTYYADNFMFSHNFRTTLINSCNVSRESVIESCKCALKDFFDKGGY